MKNKRNNIRSLAVAGVVIGLVLAACGDPDDQPGAAAGAGGQLPEVVLPQNPGWNLGYFDRGVVEQAQRQQRPASRGVEIELELQKRAREASVVEHPGWNLGYFDRGVVEQARVQQGPQSQFAAIEEALEAHADEVTAQNAEAFNRDESVPDLQMR